MRETVTVYKSTRLHITKLINQDLHDKMSALLSVYKYVNM